VQNNNVGAKTRVMSALYKTILLFAMPVDLSDVNV